MIPKVIHYLWMSAQKTPDAEECIASWKRLLPDYEIKEWNSHNFPYQDFIWTKEAVSRKKWAFVSDFFRMWVLEKYGGIYMDADVTMTGSFDEVLNCPLFIGTEGATRLGSHLIGAEKGHPFISRCLQYYDNRHFIKSDGTLDMIPNPYIITRIFMSMYHYDGALLTFDGTPLKMKDMIIYPDTFFTINVFNRKNICYHNGLGSWRDETTGERGTIEDAIGHYVRYETFCHSMSRKLKGINKLLFMAMPLGLLCKRYQRRLVLANNKDVTSVSLDGVDLSVL